MVNEQAVRALTRALERKVWREDGWEVPAIDVQEALDALTAHSEEPPDPEEEAPKLNPAERRNDEFTRLDPLPLDPKPWVCNFHPGERWAQRPTSCHFAPREGYSQNREDYT